MTCTLDDNVIAVAALLAEATERFQDRVLTSDVCEELRAAWRGAVAEAVEAGLCPLADAEDVAACPLADAEPRRTRVDM